MFTQILKLFAILSIIFSAQLSLAEIAMNLAYTSNYVSRGVTNSNNLGALQGGIDYKHSSQFLLGTWASSLGESENGTELDLYTGYERELSEDLTVGAKVFSYVYEKDSDKNSFDTNLYVSHNQTTFNLFYAPEIKIPDSDEKLRNFYMNVSHTFLLPKSYKVALAFGQSIYNDRELADSNNYIDYNLSVQKSFEPVVLNMTFSDTNRKNASDENQKDQAVFFSATVEI